MKLAIFVAAIAASTSSLAQAQDNNEQLPRGFVPEHWVPIENAEGERVLAHKMSGALCPRVVDGMVISALTSHSEGGNDVSCNYVADGGAEKLTVYYYKYPDLTGPKAFSGAVAGIKQVAQTTALTVTPEAAETQRCANVLSTGLSNTLPLPEGQSGYPVGYYVFDQEGPETGAGSDVDQVSSLAVFEHDSWIVKVRYTRNDAPDQNDYYQACGKSAFVLIQSAEALKQNAGLRKQ